MGLSSTGNLSLSSGVFDPEAGLVDAAMGNAAHQQCALRRGAEIWSQTKVDKMQKLPGGGMKVRGWDGFL